MAFAVVAHSWSETNVALAGAWRGCRSFGVLSPWEALRFLAPGDIALGRIDVRPTLDGPESGFAELTDLAERRGVAVLNSPRALLAAHDKLLTAHLLRSDGIPTPWTRSFGGDVHGLRDRPGPYVLKPRFGSWGKDVLRADTLEELSALAEQLSTRPWLRSGGAIVQGLIPPLGWDVRVIVANGRPVGAIRREAATGEWRTNVARGARRIPHRIPLGAVELACRAVAVTGLDLGGVDILPLAGGRLVVLEVNGAPDFSGEYSLGADAFALAAAELSASLGRLEPAVAVGAASA
ncbi:MAG: ATP-grasp domain-containing protein [Gaiellaceae bacterium]